MAAGPVHRATVDVTSSDDRAPDDPAALTAPLVAGPVSVGSFDVGSGASFDGGSLFRRLPASEAPGTRRDVVSASAGASGETPVVPLSSVATTPSGRFMPSISSSNVARSTASAESGAHGSASLPVASIGSASTRSSGVASSEPLSALSSTGSSGLIGRQNDAGSTAPMPGTGGSTDAGLSGEWSTDSGFDADSPFIFRESDDGAAGGAPPAATGAAGAAGGPAAGAASGAAQSDAELDKLAGRLYERLRHKLRRELLDDRERAGFALDRVR